MKATSLGRIVTIGAIAFCLMSAGTPAATAGNDLPGTDVLGTNVKRLMKPNPQEPVLPDDPFVALSDAVDDFSRVLGVRQDPAAKAPIDVLPRDVAGRLAILTRKAHRCHRKSQGLVAELGGIEGLGQATLEDGSGPDPTLLTTSSMRDCAADLQDAAVETATFLTSLLPGQLQELDLWPVLRVSGTDSANLYEQDYALIVDVAGDDFYANNAGGNLMDVRRAPVGWMGTAEGADGGTISSGPAVGCQWIPDLAARNCVVSSSLLIDVSGNDTYGFKESPDPFVDGTCTTDPVVRRIVTQGAGLAGVGALIELSGDDTYTAKTVSQGSGHVGGVGVLLDASGDDRYEAIRNSQGFALITGVGVLNDAGGNDGYFWYVPAPSSTTADASNEEDGSGGVRDDRGKCDSLPRMLQGTALIAGIGIFMDAAGADIYDAPSPAIQMFIRADEDKDGEAENRPVALNHGSLGFGSGGGLGFFFDSAGMDGYPDWGDAANDGVVQRANDLVLNLGDEQPYVDENSPSTGQFRDENSPS
ncbi:MAG: hypothetical protein M3N53_00310 [Actinomycetota bacterium]|nr:hypothetical protein [Actinomycetota bacterium]